MNAIKPLALAILLVFGGSLALPAAAAEKSAEKSLEQNLSDANKEGRIWASFALNRHLNPFEFDVKVNGETVTLGGTVDESIDKELAEQVALGVSGVKKVVNNVKVDPDWAPKPRPAGERSFGQAAEDATITATVKSKLLWSEHTDGLDINVDTASGVVTLRGKVPTAEGKDLAARYAANTGGVRKVNNELVVASDAKRAAASSEQPVTDTWVTAKVKSSLTLSRPLMDDDIDVKTVNGVVSLDGLVETAAEKSLAIEIADNIRGAKKVDAGGLKTRR
ncbi:osmotically-inducible protein OsmY [Tahibacter aquaticus]|uniref:Osmotically-inducible protein OsmY n=1 Tax=Tahibacter aquaticus TaxID=520092 RepID=A0A4V3DNA2_9GAMM|nr:BON domain-containing protein [Tahibacter aquaticus]TDR47636.1 osmotically-inducible protein OsmY [Tahibacter aquaticus]